MTGGARHRRPAIRRARAIAQNPQPQAASHHSILEYERRHPILRWRSWARDNPLKAAPAWPRFTAFATARLDDLLWGKSSSYYVLLEEARSSARL
jgi:hypothetical protein